ncbi:PIN-like domain-containing protein [Streptomyces tauricus]|uniref:PIN-like domain-containing protein n=1 Tax=Streptomyces tauricus TaxID=68274 RepID=UPI003434DA5E
MPDYPPGSFTSGYEEYWRKSIDFTDEAIRHSSLVLDTNSILNLYRMKLSARNEYLRVLEKAADRIWIPRQVADEFHKNRISSVAGHRRSLEDKHKAVLEAAGTLKAKLRDFYRLHSLADGRSNEYLAPLNESIDQITETVRDEVQEYDLNPGSLLSNDPILTKIAVLFDGKVGDGLPEETYEEAKEEAKRRGDTSTPPGYIDMQQKGEDGVGDFIIWTEMLEHAKKSQKGILFVSTDTKEDWIRIQCGMSVGPRPELVREMRETADASYHQLPLSLFLARAAEVFEVEVSQDTINQANEATQSEEKAKQHVLRRQEQIEDLDEKIMEVRKMLLPVMQKLNVTLKQETYLRNQLSGADSEENREQLFSDLSALASDRKHLEERVNGIRNGLGALESQKDSFMTEVTVLERWAI